MVRKHYVYSLRSRGKVTYIGKTTNPRRRASQHRKDGKAGRLKIEKVFESHPSARLSEALRLSAFRKKYGRNPRYNKTDSGGWPR